MLSNFFIPLFRQTSSSPHLPKEQNGIGGGWASGGFDLGGIKAAVHTCAVLRPHLLHCVIPQNSLGWKNY